MSGFYVPGGRADGDLVELTICVLEGQGHVELESDDDVDGLVAELADVLELHRGCILVLGDVYARDAEQLARCWCVERRLEWERQAPRFTCACGAVYGLENSGWHGHAFFALADDGTFDGDVSECGCGRELAALRDRRREAEASGQPVLFE